MHFFSPAKTVFGLFFLSLLFWGIRFYGCLPAITDVFLFTYPSQSINQMELSKGFIPLWDAYTGCGMPQLANSLSACAYPPFWIWFWTGLSHWMVWVSLGHAGFAFLGFYFWARSRKIYSLWAALGAFSFAGSLLFVRCWGYPIFSATQSWLPWIFLAASRWLESGRLRWWGCLAIAIGLQILAGYPYFTFYCLVFLALWTLFQSPSWNLKAGLFLSIPAALGLAAVHWIPFVDYLFYSTRGMEKAPEQFAYFTKPLEYLTLISPGILGKPETAAYAGETANANFMLYFGLVPLAVWVVLGWAKKFEGRTFWGLASFAWLLWLAGYWLPLWRIFPLAWLEALNPSKAVGVFIFAVCTLVGMTLTRMGSEGWNEKKRRAFEWIVAALWALDLICLPFRIMHPVSDPFLNKENQDWSRQVKETAQGERALSFKAKGQTTVVGEKDVYRQAADDWVHNLLANSMAVWGIRGSHAYLSTWTVSMDKFWQAFNKLPTYGGRLPDIAGVEALFLPVQLQEPHYQLLGKSGKGFLLQNRYCRPAVWQAYGEKDFQDQESILSVLSEEEKNPETREEVDLERGMELPPPQRGLAAAGQAGVLSGFNRPGASRAVYEGSFTGTGWLAWNETFTPGWRAWVDGKPVPIYRAYGFFMAVPVEGAGNHRVDLRYEPAAFRLGLFISLLFLAMTPGLGVGMASFRRRVTLKG